MATAPAFAATPIVWTGLVPATFDTSLTAPTNATTLGTANAANGSKIEEIVVQGVLTTVAAVVNIFLHDGTTYHLYDQFVITAVTSSTTAAAFRVSKTYANLVLPKATPTWTLRCTVTVAGDQSGLKVTATGGDF